jgi:acetyl esterase
VGVIATRYLGQIHDFGLLNGVQEVPSTQEALHQASDALRKFLTP